MCIVRCDIQDSELLSLDSSLIAKQREGPNVFEYPFLMQFHGKVPVEAAALAVVACSKVLPHTIIPGFGH